MKNAEECTQDPIQKAKRSRTNARSKFTRKCNAFIELKERGEQFLVLQDKFNDIRDIFKELDTANDRLIDTINENAPHHVLDGMIEDCDAYMTDVESTLDRIRAMYASCVSQAPSETSRSPQIHVKALDSPRFGGNIREYSSFKHDFTRLMVTTYGKDSYALRSCLYGPALQTVRGVEDDYEKMFDRLDKVYGDSRKFVDAIISDIKSIKPIHDGESRKFISMVDVIERCWLDLKRMDLSEEMDTVTMVSMVEKLLPPVLKREWIIHVDSKGLASKGMFEELLQYLLREKRVIEYTENDLRTEKSRAIHQATVNQLDKPSPSSHRPYAYTHAQAQEHHSDLSSTSRPWCWLHRTDEHSIENCDEFRKMTIVEKFETVRKFGACFNCLRATRHIARDCTESNKCDIVEANQRCRRRHHPLLHSKHTFEHREHQTSQISNVQVSQSRPLLAATVIKCQNQQINVMWDSGANISLITHDAAERLGLQGDEISLSIVKVGGDLTSYTSREYQVPLVDLAGKIWIVKAYGINEIASNPQRVDIQQVKSHFPGIDISRFTEPEGKIDMLVGVDFCTILPTVVRTVGNSQLLENQFGYCVRGAFEAAAIENERTNATIRIHHTNIDSHQDRIKIESSKLRSTENRLQKLDADYRRAYCEQMIHMEKRGVARKLSNEKIQSYRGPVHCIHHHEVLKQNSSSTPIRIAFNSSASHMGHVLNKYWTKGLIVLIALIGLHTIAEKFGERYPEATTMITKNNTDTKTASQVQDILANDASSQAYGARAYVRRQLQSEMTCKFQEVVYVVDSTIVRSQIQKQPYGFGTFVATGIAEIQDKTSPSELWWTGGHNNPADRTIRYTEADELNSNSVWHGKQRNFQVGGIVIVREDKPARGSRRLAEINKVESSSDGFVRDVTSRYKPLASASQYNGWPDILIRRAAHRRY